VAARYRSSKRTAFGVVAAVAAVAAVSLQLTRPNRPSKSVVIQHLALPASAALPAEGIPPLATVTATATSAASSSAATAVAAVPSGAEGFAEAFQKNAARKNAKWAELKPPTSKSDPTQAGAGKLTPGMPAAKKPSEPAAGDPMDVLKRLEEARKSKKP
jgi:hypothetical protein